MARRRWEFDLGDGHHLVELDHRYFIGTLRITVDGVTTTQRGRPFMDHSGVYPFQIGARQADVRISTDGFHYYYDVTIDGRSVESGKPAASPRSPVGGPRQRRAL